MRAVLNPSAPTNSFFPALNAGLNGLAAVLLLVGYVLIRKRHVHAHKKVMWTAFATSATFLAFYLYYHFNYSSQKFGGQGVIRPIYFGMLISHIFLAVLILPFIFRLLYLASKESFHKHARLARYVWPVWMYTSITGVLIYFMLYAWYPAKIAAVVP